MQLIHQPPLSPRQRSLSLGGLTVSSVLVPPDTISTATINADAEGNFDTSVGYSISIFSNLISQEQ